MAKLYPPNIQGVIPAFYGTTLVVPFSMNKAVGESEVFGFQVKIKTISGELKITKKANYENIDFESGQVTFIDLPELDSFKNKIFNIGQFYKVQIAYIDKSGVVGYFSTVGISKYTVQPEVYIEGLDPEIANTHIYNYVGVYSQKSSSEQQRDASEKLYSSRFIVWDENKNVYKDSGEIVHNTTKDVTTYEASEQFSLTEDLEDEKIFYIQFSIQTVNLLQMKSPIYRFKQRRSISPEQKVYIHAENDYVNGCINLSMTADNDKVTGSFIISKSNSKNNFLDWEELFRFDLKYSINPIRWSAKDFTSEQGIYYKYAIQQCNDKGVLSEKTISEKIFSDFEDSFLYDGEKLLNVRFNPKVSSFKITLQENKQDTIGSQFAYFFRNGHVNYKEFPISGLVSYLSDVDKLFMEEDKYIVDVETTNLTSENISTERLFKLEVLKWLTNGKPKLFKSPGEGNYIVRLMNSSLSPTDSLSRMLHSFSTTAYEIMEFNGENLRACGFVGNMSIPEPTKAMKTVAISELLDGVTPDKQGFYTFSSGGFNSLAFTGLDPGTIIRIGKEDFMIGGTGSFYFDENGNKNNREVVSIKPVDPSNVLIQGTATYAYNQKTEGYFDLITSVETMEIPLIQFFGNFYNEEKLVNSDGELYQSENIYDFLQDARTEIAKMYMIRLEKRSKEYLYLNPDDKDSIDNLNALTSKRSLEIGDVNLLDIKIYKDRECKEIILDRKYFTPNKYYPLRYGYTEEILNKEKDTYDGYFIDALDEELCPYLDYAIDGLSFQFFRIDDTLYKAIVDGAWIDIESGITYTVPEPNYVKYLEIGHGVTAELSYTKLISNYSIEEINLKLKQLKKTYLNLLNYALILDGDHKYFLTFGDGNFKLEYNDKSGNNGGRIESSAILREAYEAYLSELSKQLKEYKEKNQLI